MVDQFHVPDLESLDVAPASAVDRTHRHILDRILGFAIRPGERINESELSRDLGVSRTPLREALNRLVSEGFLVSRPPKGVFCRDISANEIFQLYQLRAAIEVGGIKLAIVRATNDELDALEEFLRESRLARDADSQTQVSFDEAFHEKLMALSGNGEMLTMLRSINRKIRSIRWIDLTRAGREGTQNEHSAILACLRERDVDRCVQVVEAHITRRLDQIDAAIREVFGHIYTGMATR